MLVMNSTMAIAARTVNPIRTRRLSRRVATTPYSTDPTVPPSARARPPVTPCWVESPEVTKS